MLDIVKGHSSELMKRVVVDGDMIALQLLLYKNMARYRGLSSNATSDWSRVVKVKFDLEFYQFSSSIPCGNPVLFLLEIHTTTI